MNVNCHKVKTPIKQVQGPTSKVEAAWDGIVVAMPDVSRQHTWGVCHIA